MPTVFFTVGSTKFDALIEAALSDDVVAALMARGMRAMVVQYGNSQIQDQFKIESTLHDMGIAVELWQWKPSLKQVIESSDLVVSHAGSGTILDVLRLSKPLIVVPNSTLMDDHQSELALALEERGYLVTATPTTLAEVISAYDNSKIISFPPFDPSKFRNLLDERLGLGSE